MKRPRFSVIIPTRERPRTLQFCLETCIAQTFDDYEIVVCDNYGSPETRAIVDAVESPRIVYHRAPALLPMADNWNLAYSQSSGEFVIFIGDDDGLMPYALMQLDHLIRESGVQAITWDAGVYTWPNILRSDQANCLQFAVTTFRREYDGRAAIQDVVTGQAPAVILPNVYHGCVSREILEGIRARSGYIAKGHGPDTYTSFSVAYVAQRYLRLRLPMSISGFSAASATGSFTLTNAKQGAAQQTWQNNQASAAHRLHRSLPNLLSPLVVVADSFLSAKADLFHDDSSLELDRRWFIGQLLENLPIDELAEWQPAIDAIRLSVESDPSLEAWFEERIAGLEIAAPSRPSLVSKRRGLVGGHMCLAAADHGVYDVAAAARLVNAILAPLVDTITWHNTEQLDLVVLPELLARVRSTRITRRDDQAASESKRDEELHATQVRLAQLENAYNALLSEHKNLQTYYNVLVDDRNNVGASYLALEQAYRTLINERDHLRTSSRLEK